MRDPLTLPKFWGHLPTLEAATKRGQKRPLVGITQGGSSRKDAGAKSAAYDADAQRKGRQA